MSSYAQNKREFHYLFFCCFFYEGIQVYQLSFSKVHCDMAQLISTPRACQQRACVLHIIIGNFLFFLKEQLENMDSYLGCCCYSHNFKNSIKQLLVCQTAACVQSLEKNVYLMQSVFNWRILKELCWGVQDILLGRHAISYYQQLLICSACCTL